MKKRGHKQGKEKFANQPFKKLSKLVQAAADEARSDLDASPSKALEPHTSEPLLVETAGPFDDEVLLARALSDVVPLSDSRPLVEKKAQPRPMLVLADEEALVMRHLDELVNGEATFDFADTSEYIEASQKGLDKRVLRKLRRGELSWQAHLDLHGLNREEARAKVGAFIADSIRDNRRCVLIVHGRGLGSKDNTPVLKNKLAAWLTRGAIGKKVLAYTSAKPYDGGTGAVYVLLRCH